MILLGLAHAGVTLDAETFPVHDKVSIVVTVDDVLQPGDAVVIDEPLFHGMRWAKWGYLQTNPSACTPRSEDGDVASVGLVRASAEGAELQVTHTVNGPGIHEAAAIDVEVVSGRSDELVIELGVVEDDCGWQTADRAFEHIVLPVTVHTGTTEDATTLLLAFEPGAYASTQAFVPSQAVVGEQVELTVVDLDEWGNALDVRTDTLAFDDPGVFRVQTSGVRSNPIRITPEPLQHNVFWGDLHTHHGESWQDGDDWIDANHLYARDVLALDFGCESVKGYPHELEYEDLWEAQKKSCLEYTDDRYLAVLGFEWMGGSTEGHHNVYYATCDGPLGPMDLETVAEGLWPFVEDLDQDVVTIPHAPSFTGYNWDVADEELRPVAEVYSEWGSSMEPVRNGSVPQGLSLGQRLGFIASSDNHDGWIGNQLAIKNAPGGLAAIRMETLSTPNLLTALHERNSYATTGARMLLDVTATQDGVEHPMGAAFVARETRLDWSAHGTEKLAQVRVVASRVGARELAFELASWTPETLDASGTAWIPWGPDDLAVWVEVTQVDGEMGWTSPVFLEREAAPPAGGCNGRGAWILLPALLLGRLVSRRRFTR